MAKFQVSISFSIDERFMSKVPAHRAVIVDLMKRGFIDSYAISAENERGWISMTAESKDEIYDILSDSPLYEYFYIEIDQLMVYDRAMAFTPKVMLN